jgi:uncharacterized alkaline shock family protein YloU
MQTFASSSAHQTNASQDGAAPSAAPVAGSIFISPRVIFTLALSAALATYGVVGIASRYTGADCTHTDPRRGLEIDIDRGEDDGYADGFPHVTVAIHIIVEYGVRILAVTTSLQHQIKYRIERSTDYVVDAVRVHVSGLRVTHAT